jgi:hypothetical protein
MSQRGPLRKEADGMPRRGGEPEAVTALSERPWRALKDRAARKPGSKLLETLQITLGCPGGSRELLNAVNPS